MNRNLLCLFAALLGGVLSVAAGSPGDSLPARRLVHGAEVWCGAERLIMDNDFVNGLNAAGRRVDFSRSAHVRYRARLAQGSLLERVYGPVSTGAGVTLYTFGNRRELGNPVAAYIFQSGTAIRFTRSLSLDWEWNVGLSCGWRPFDEMTNPKQILVGSSVNAYVDGSFYLTCLLSRRWSLTAGGTFSHFSNGNTAFPNRGLDMAGVRFGLGYAFGEGYGAVGRPERYAAPEFPRHLNYDVVLYGAWSYGVADIGDGLLLVSPRKYGIAGLNISAMYNAGYRFRAGLSLDGEWLGCAAISPGDVLCELGGNCDDYPFRNPPLWRQLSCGVSARAELVLPVFTVGAGVGVTVWRGSRDFKRCYQLFTLKIATTHNTFVQIGYRYMEHLMLGVGYRFNNRYPRLR